MQRAEVRVHREAQSELRPKAQQTIDATYCGPQTVRSAPASEAYMLT